MISNAGDLDVNSQAFRAQGVEGEFDYTVFKNLFLRAGYTYLDAVVERSFTSDALQPPLIPACRVSRRHPSLGADRRFRSSAGARPLTVRHIPATPRSAIAANNIG